MLRAKLAFVVGSVILLSLNTLYGDVITTKDGRRFEGSLVSKDDEQVRFDTMVGRVRVVFTLPRREVTSIDEKELPAGFFDPPPAAPRMSDRKRIDPDAELYLEVPIHGEIGTDVYSDAVASVFRYADRHRIGHIVFHIDSAGGEIDETFAIYDLMKEYDHKLEYHAIIKRCLGGPLAFAVWCESVNLLPGGIVGGQGRKFSAEELETLGGEEESIVREQLLHRVLADTGRGERAAEMVRAMLDPNESFFAWKDSRGRIVTREEVAEGVEPGDVVIRAPEGTPLQLTYKQALAIGMPKFTGGAADLGPLLRIDKWNAESDYGARTITSVAENKRRTAKRKQSTFERKVRSNVQRREKTQNYIEDNIQRAAAYDPSATTYETYQQRWAWGWGWSGNHDSKQLTTQSRRKWKSRTDACIHFLTKAARGLNSMKRLDAEALKLGVEPNYAPGEIDDMIRDIKGRITRLGAERNRRVRD